MRQIGHSGAGFAFDHERPRHRVFLAAFRIADRQVTNGEYLSFIHDCGYERPELWLSEGWDARVSQNWTAPLYWTEQNGRTEQDGRIDGKQFTLQGLRDIDAAAPVTHVRYFEADAYARWASARLPTGAEWETAAAGEPPSGNFLESGHLHPIPGAIGEYNGKFMVNQYVLRGGSCATPESHIRASYRNFFPSAARWQFSGIRLAEDI